MFNGKDKIIRLIVVYIRKAHYKWVNIFQNDTIFRSKSKGWIRYI